MMKRILGLFNHTSQTMYNAAFIIATCTMLGHLLAIVRDRAFAHTFGASTTLDIYFAAFRIPDILFTIGSTLIGSAILLPYLTPYAKDEIKMRSIANDIFTVFAIGFLILLIIVFVTMPFLLKLLAKEFSPENFTTLVTMSRLLLLSPLILGISNLFSTITQSLQKFFVSSLAPVVYNVGIIVGVLLLYPYFGIYGLAFGVILGAVFHIGIQLPTLVISKGLPKFHRVQDWQLIKKIALTALPRTFTLSTNKIELFLLTALGVFIAEGSVSVFNLTWNLQNAPLSLIGASIAVAVYPMLIRARASADITTFNQQLQKALQSAFFWTIPITGGIFIFSESIVRLILGTGAFQGDTITVAAAALATFVIGLPSQAAILIYVRARYAKGDTWKPFWANLFASAAPVIFAYVCLAMPIGDTLFGWLYNIFNIDGMAGRQVIILTTSFALGTLIGHTLLWMIEGKQCAQNASRHLGSVIVATIGMMIIMRIIATKLQMHYAIELLIGGLAGVIALVIILHIFKNEELAYLINRTKSYLRIL